MKRAALTLLAVALAVPPAAAQQYKLRTDVSPADATKTVYKTDRITIDEATGLTWTKDGAVRGTLGFTALPDLAAYGDVCAANEAVVRDGSDAANVCVNPEEETHASEHGTAGDDAVSLDASQIASGQLAGAQGGMGTPQPDCGNIAVVCDGSVCRCQTTPVPTISATPEFPVPVGSPSPVIGSSEALAKSDHRHQLEASGVTPGSYGGAPSVTTFTVDSHGRITVAGTTAIAIGTSQITSGTLGVARGGLGIATLTGAGRILYSTDATTIATLAPNATATIMSLVQQSSGAPLWSDRRLIAQVNNAGTARCDTMDFGPEFTLSDAADGADNNECEVGIASTIMTTQTPLSMTQLPLIMANDGGKRCWGTDGVNDMCLWFDGAGDTGRISGNPTFTEGAVIPAGQDLNAGAGGMIIPYTAATPHPAPTAAGRIQANTTTKEVTIGTGADRIKLTNCQYAVVETTKLGLSQSAKQWVRGNQASTLFAWISAPMPVPDGTASIVRVCATHRDAYTAGSHTIGMATGAAGSPTDCTGTAVLNSGTAHTPVCAAVTNCALTDGKHYSFTQVPSTSPTPDPQNLISMMAVVEFCK